MHEHTFVSKDFAESEPLDYWKGGLTAAERHQRPNPDNRDHAITWMFHLVRPQSSSNHRSQSRRCHSRQEPQPDPIAHSHTSSHWKYWDDRVRFNPTPNGYSMDVLYVYIYIYTYIYVLGWYWDGYRQTDASHRNSTRTENQEFLGDYGEGQTASQGEGR